MWRWTKRILLLASGAAAAAALAGAAYQWFATRAELRANPPPGRLVDVGGHRLHIWCSGSGAPAVILESGLGGGTSDWGFVQPEVARFTRVCSYDRAGAGYSDSGPWPRIASRIARELARLVESSGITGPLILVGASLGGLYVRLFAAEHEQDVAGLVLVDASHENQRHEVPGLARFVPLLSSTGAFRVLGVSFGPSNESLAPAVRQFARATQFRASTYQAAASELMHVHESSAEVRAARRRTLAVPLVVLTAGRGSDSVWRELQRDQVTLSKRGCQMIAEQSGHAIPMGQPQTVVDAIRAVVDAARGRTNAVPCPASP
jgi:pimeloyl-ACP methyl ester carboxylesterase